MSESNKSSAGNNSEWGPTPNPPTETEQLISTIKDQTAAIGQLVAMNQKILEALLEAEPGDEDGQSGGGYLNG